jgi:AcrR family transcriptional regulator
MIAPPFSGGDPTPPAEGSGAVTRDRLLDAAEGLFARKGYAGTSVREITASAECNLAAVNYHFGSKRKLYREVFRRRLGAMREQRLAAVEAAVRSAGDATDDYAATLLAFAQSFLEPLREDSAGRGPLRLMLREIVDPLLPPDFLQTELIVPVTRGLNEVVAKVAPELSQREVLLCVQSFLGQLLHIIHAQRLAATSLADADEPFTQAELAEHVVRFTIAAIERLRLQASPTTPLPRSSPDPAARRRR